MLPLLSALAVLEAGCDVTGREADPDGAQRAVSHREYQCLKRKTEVLKRRLRAERARSARLAVLSGDSAYRLSALRLATLALSIQETYQEMVLDLGSLLQQLAGLVCDAGSPPTLPPPDGVGGWYRQVRELAAAALRSLIEKRAETGQVRSEISEVLSREPSPAGDTRHKRGLVTVVCLGGDRARAQITDHGLSFGFRDRGRRESRHIRTERSSPSAETGDERSTGRISSRADIQPPTLVCSSQKSTPRENPTESESSFPYRPQATEAQVARRKCSQSHQMCDSDLGPCLKSKGHGGEGRHHSDSTSDEEAAVDIACCSRACHHHSYLKTFVESQKRSQETGRSVSLKNVILNSSSRETGVADVGPTSSDAPEAAFRSCAHPALSVHASGSSKKTRRDGRTRSSPSASAEAEQKPAGDFTQYGSAKKCVSSERGGTSTSGEKRYEPPKPSQTERTAQYLPGREGLGVTKSNAESFCSAPSLGAKELPEHLRGQVEVLEKGPTSSDYTETISSSITASRTSYNSPSSSSVPKTKLRSRRAVRPVTSSGTDTRQSSGSPKGEQASPGRGGERSESACDESTTLTPTPTSGSLSAQQGLQIRFVEILDELKEKLLQCDE